MNEALEKELKELIVDALMLDDVTPAEIESEAPLFGSGLGLDSIDVLEVVASIEKEFSVVIQSQEEGERVLTSVQGIGDFLLEMGYHDA